MRVLVRTIGCRANQADSNALVRALDPELVRAVDDPALADVIVVNTCLRHRRGRA